jgi:gamma-glutamyltranspeptidase/glutathione hydrolase
MQAHGGLITAADLDGYQARELEPLKVLYRNHPVHTMPPASGGGTTLAVALNVMNRYAADLGREGSAAVRHLQIEAIRRGLAGSRAAENDPAQLAKVLTPAYAEELSRNLSLDRATPPPAPARRGESPDTTHFSVIDAEGNMVANTYTLSGFFGSQVVAAGTGVLLNNHMSVFTSPARLRRLAPGQRYPSTMAPTILLKPGGSPWVALGTPGAATIPSTLFQVVMNLVDFRMSLRDAIEFPRLHPGTEAVDAEPAALIYDIAERLLQMGHKLNPNLRSQGDVSAVMVEDGGWRLGWADGRRGGVVRGY